MSRVDLRDLRARDPDAVRRAALERQRRPLLRDDGRLLLVAADHPARGALGVGGAPMAMADRDELLRRLRIVLDHPEVDGILATADIVDDLLLLGALEGKVVLGSMNRGGLQGASFELDDRFTGYDAATLSGLGFEGGKMLCRIDPADPASVRTLEACAQGVTALASEGLMALVEPFMSSRSEGRLANDLRPDAVIRSIQIAAGLGATSRHTWLKLPVVEDMERVMRSTTLPTLLLGGDPKGSQGELFERFAGALALPGVRGLVVGRALLYPPDEDVAKAVDDVAALVRA